MYTLSTVEVIADSLNSQTGARLTTLIIDKFPKSLVLDFNTHRLFSRNSASSRAIPTKTMLDRILELPFIPRWRRRNEKGGMSQGNFYDQEGEEGLSQVGILDQLALAFMPTVIDFVKQLEKFGVAKEVANRYLEPFMFTRIIVSATDWGNFTALRANPAAQYEIRHTAEQVLVALNNSTPKILKPGEWHVPFGDKIDQKRIAEIEGADFGDAGETMRVFEKTNIGNLGKFLALMVAVARCARISYLNFLGKDDYLADIKLCTNLLNSGHASPFEHVARAMSLQEYLACTSAKIGIDGGIELEYGWMGNFNGWIQLRKFIPNEWRTDDRIKNPFKLN